MDKPNLKSDYLWGTVKKMLRNRYKTDMPHDLVEEIYREILVCEYGGDQTRVKNVSDENQKKEIPLTCRRYIETKAPRIRLSLQKGYISGDKRIGDQERECWEIYGAETLDEKKIKQKLLLLQSKKNKDMRYFDWSKIEATVSKFLNRKLTPEERDLLKEQIAYQDINSLAREYGYKVETVKKHAVEFDNLRQDWKPEIKELLREDVFSYCCLIVPLYIEEDDDGLFINIEAFDYFQELTEKMTYDLKRWSDFLTKELKIKKYTVSRELSKLRQEVKNKWFNAYIFASNLRYLRKLFSIEPSEEKWQMLTLFNETGRWIDNYWYKAYHVMRAKNLTQLKEALKHDKWLSDNYEKFKSYLEERNDIVKQVNLIAKTTKELYTTPSDTEEE